MDTSNTTSTLDITIEGNDIDEKFKALLDSPVFVSATASDNTGKLYTYRQMCAMYKLGKDAGYQGYISDSTDGILSESVRRPYPELRNMNVNDTIFFPIESWSAARSAASVLKKQFGSRYIVSKIISKEEIPQIVVFRKS